MNLEEAEFDERSDFGGVNFTSLDLRKVTSLRLYKLERADLSKVNLSGMNLSDAKLSGAKFSGTHLKGVVFKDAQLQDAEFADLDVDGVSFASADLSWAKFRAPKNLDKATFNQAVLVGASFAKIILHDAKNLGQAGSLDGADFSGATIDVIHWDGHEELNSINFRDAVLKKCSFRAARFGEFTARPPKEEKPNPAKVRQPTTPAQDESVRLEPTVDGERSKSLPKRANFFNAKLAGCDFSDAKLPMANMRRAVLVGARFPGTDMRGVDLKGADVKDAVFTEKTQLDCDTLITAANWQLSKRTGPLRDCQEKRAQK